MAIATQLQQADAKQGLLEVADAPVEVREVDLEALASWNGRDGAAVKLEAGYHPLKNLEAYAAATWNQGMGLGAEAGLRYVLEW